MISLFRIDFRLLHYQTSQVWPKKLDINMIVVANDAVIQDPLRMSLMKMSAPANCGLKILSVEKAGLFLMDPKNERRRIELLVPLTWHFPEFFHNFLRDFLYKAPNPAY